MTTVLVGALGAWLARRLARAAARTEGGARARGLRAARPWHLPRRWRSPLERALADAAVPVEPEAAVELAGVAGVAGVTLAWALSPVLAPIAVAVAVAAGPVALRLARGRAERRFVAALPAGVEQVAASLRGGAAVGESIALLEGSAPLAVDVRRVRQRVELGLGLADALAAWPEERRIPDVRAVAGALAVAATLGGRAADALDGLAASLRARLGALAEAHAQSSQARLSALVVGGAPIAYLAFGAIVDPSSVGILVGTGVGRVCLVLGVACEVLAALWMRAILRRGAAA